MPPLASPPATRRFFGKYRGTVQNNIDPLLQGRIQVRVPAVLGDSTLGWALPCSPYAGPSVGLVSVPPVGANVWVEFEAGDPDTPIYAGCFWGAGELPSVATLPQIITLTTPAGSLTIDGITQQLAIKLATGAAITLSPTGIDINAGPGQVTINGVRVSINNGALDVI